MLLSQTRAGSCEALLRLPVPSAAERARSMCAEAPLRNAPCRNVKEAVRKNQSLYSALYIASSCPYTSPLVCRGRKPQSELGWICIALVPRDVDASQKLTCIDAIFRRKAMRPTKNAVRASCKRSVLDVMCESPNLSELHSGAMLQDLAALPVDTQCSQTSEIL